jgi:hypothetical protein
LPELTGLKVQETLSSCKPASFTLN